MDLGTERELLLKDFIAVGLAAGTADDTADLLLVARTPASAACRAVFANSQALADRGVHARIVLAAGAAGDHWQLDFAPGFAHEIRIAADPRVLDAHEQLVVGAQCLWFGDSMRRDPDKRDAYAQFTADDRPGVRCARLTFGRLWAAARPLYRRERHATAAAMHAPATGPDAAAVLAQEVLATLEAWQPPSRH
jgi:hypothetical protein